MNPNGGMLLGLDDSGMLIRNESGLPTDDVFRAIREDQSLMAAFTQWTGTARGENQFSAGAGWGNGVPQPRSGGLFSRDRYVTPESIYQQMRLAYDAVESDDIVGGVADTTEALAVGRVSFYSEDKDEQDIYNQIAADIDLDSRLREMWRESFTVSQFYVAIWWIDKVYKVRGTSEKGVAKRKSYRLRVPKAISLLDPLKIVPMGTTIFNQEQLCYAATATEALAFDDEEKRRDDPIISRLFLTRYTPDDDEKRWLDAEGIPADNLFVLNPENVFRHTLTRPGFRRLSPLRMKPVFELLDMKHQLRSMDRAHLIGGTNFIVLIKKGSDEIPGQPEEIANLQQNVKTLAKLPVIVGDHRLSVEIITPKMDATLSSDRYQTLDSRITARLYGMFVLGGGRSGAGANTDDSSGLIKIIAKGIESRRHMITRSLEKHILQPMFQKNDGLKTAPKLKYHPKSIDLGFDASLASFMMELRQSRELSRETMLSQFDFDQADEARMLEREADEYDDIFQTQVPFSAPAPTGNGGDLTPAQKRQAGRQGGGTRNGGGAAPGTGQGKDPVNPNNKS